uniref:Glucosylceramidase n=1 Tax=Acrobeloides nanus TaxID=290746 RepID=A0A914C5M9_9BILA
MIMDDNHFSYDEQHNRYDGVQRYAADVYGDPEASKIVDGIAIHWYSDGTQPDTDSLIAAHEKYPDKFLLYTEVLILPFLNLFYFKACNLNAPVFGSWQEADNYAFSLIETLNSWVIGWTDWNMCLDPNGQPSWIDSQLESPIIVSNVSDEFEKQPMYYALGHVAKFIVPNSTIIGLEWENPIPELIGTAAITPTGEHVIFLNNRDNSTSHTVTVYNNKGGWTSLTLEPRSFTTVVYNVTGGMSDMLAHVPTSTCDVPMGTCASNSWSWINNDTSVYRNWRSGYPSSNSNNIYSQLNMADGKWTNIDGTAQACYVCEVRA